MKNRSTTALGTYLVSLLALIGFACAAQPVALARANEPELKNLTVSIWPEYDQPSSVLVIFRGEVKEGTELPVTVRFLFPKSARLSSTSSVDSNDQFQYEKAWNSRRLAEKEDFTELTYEIQHRRFQFEVYDPLSTEARVRDYSFPLKLALPAVSLEVEVQQPLRASGFSLSPEASRTTTDAEGFTYFTRAFNDAGPGQDRSFTIKYTKADARPSVGNGPQAVDTSPGRQPNPWIIGGVILAVVVLPAGAYFLARFQRTRPARAGGAKSKGVSPRTGTFCMHCGAKMPAKATYCPACGRNRG